MKESATPRNTKHATKFGMTLFKGKMSKLLKSSENFARNNIEGARAALCALCK